MSLCLFDYAYGFKSTDDVKNEFRFVVNKCGASDDDFQILLKQLESLRRVAIDHNIYMEAVTQFQSSNRLMSVHELAKYMGIGMNKAYKLVALSDFPSIKIGTKIMVDKYKLDDYLDTHKEIDV